MDTPKFTPGPWHYGVRPDGSMWLSLGNPSKGPHYQGDLVATVADANAIIAARDLYVALEPLVPFMEAFRIGEGSTDRDYEFFGPFIDRARAALALARGEA